MVVLSLYIINKSGGLVYQRDYQNNVINKLSNNDYLILAGTFHGFAINLIYHTFLMYIAFTQ